ncbi:MAG TPA: glycosyltransferase [Polyangia bacterium]|nr:glycosyltransferase [Polyangia bacterium]
MALQFPDVSLLSLDRYAALFDEREMQRMMARIGELGAMLEGRVVWNISSSAVGGGVAEMVRSLLAYARGAGVDARWAVVTGPPAFFTLTKRLHNALHGSLGDGSPLGEAERALFERVGHENAAELLPMVRPGDIAIVHDPQPAAMIASLACAGAHVVWRCHIGHDEVNGEVELGWGFVSPYLREADAYVFSRAAYVPRQLPRVRVAVIPPSIDPFSTKNQPLDEPAIEAILAHTGIIGGPEKATPRFLREDGTPGRVDRTAEILRHGGPPSAETPLVVQVSRWDRLKDPVGVLCGFARIDASAAHGAELVLAGPDVTSVADDPEGAAVYAEVVAAWHRLGEEPRRRVHLVSLPAVDVDENAAIVNALQRHARVIVQKSLHEGFGLTVTEAMWKARPIVASAVGGIQDQIDDGRQGLLVASGDLDAFARAVARLLAEPKRADELAASARRRVLERYLGIHSLLRYGALIEALETHAPATERAANP